MLLFPGADVPIRFCGYEKPPAYPASLRSIWHQGLSKKRSPALSCQYRSGIPPDAGKSLAVWKDRQKEPFSDPLHSLTKRKKKDQ